MHGKYGWALAALVWLGILMLAHRTALAAGTGGSLFPWLYGCGFLVFGVLLLGTLARWWRYGSAARWRPAMLSLGALAAAADIALLPRAAVAAPVDLWMTAVLGLVGAALLARVTPPALSHRWLGLDRRTAERGA